MNQPLVTHVAPRSIVDRLHAGEHIAMRMHDALRLARGARGEENLQRRVVRKLRHRTGFFDRKHGQPILKAHLWPLALERQQQLRIPHHQRRPHIGRHTCSKLGRPVRIERHRDHSAQHAAIKCSDPFRAVLRPQHHAVARPNTSLGQQRRETPCQPRNLFVACNPAANTDVANDRRLATVTSKIVKQRGEMGAHKLKGTPPSGCRWRRSPLPSCLCSCSSRQEFC